LRVAPGQRTAEHDFADVEVLRRERHSSVE
jgi:hypothetical protein